MAGSQHLTLAQGIGIGIAAGFVLGFVTVLFFFALICLPAKNPHLAAVSMVSEALRACRQPQDSERKIPPGPSHRVVEFTTLDEIPMFRGTVPNPNGGKPKWKPNRSVFTWKELPVRMPTMHHGKSLDEATGFSHFIEQVELGCIVENRWKGVFMPEISPSIFDEDELVQLAGEPVNGGTWSESIANRKTRGGAFKCFLAQVLFKRMDPLCNVEEGFLPPEIATLYQIMYRRIGPFKPEPTRGERVGYETLAVWRETIYLLFLETYNIQYDHRMEFAPDDSRKEKTLALMHRVMDALRLKTLNVQKEPNGALERNMEEAFEGAACAALALFCQPCVWEYEWISSKPGFMVFPEVRLVWDEDEVKFRMPAEIEERYPKPPGKELTSEHPENSGSQEAEV